MAAPIDPMLDSFEQYLTEATRISPPLGEDVQRRRFQLFDSFIQKIIFSATSYLGAEVGSLWKEVRKKQDKLTDEEIYKACKRHEAEMKSRKL